MENNITTIILTYNESLHIERAIMSVKKFSKAIYVIDSFSTDDTVSIAKSLGACVIQHKWPGNQAEQFNWALENIKISSIWILRLDADEYLTDELIEEIDSKINTVSDDVSGIILNRRTYFLGKWVKHGIYPVKLLRLFRNGKGKCENRWMDEHIILCDGKVIEFKNDFIDENLNNINWWIQKHNNYAVREALVYFDMVYGICGYSEMIETQKGMQANKKRHTKHKFYKLPLFIRAFLYFIYRYFVRFGFLDGKQGLIWAFLQAYWYRFLVDCQIFEITKHCGHDKEKIRMYFEKNYNIKL